MPKSRNSRHTFPLATGVLAVAGLALAAPTLTAQEAEQATPAAQTGEGPHLPADSMALGAQYAEWLVHYELADLWDRFSPEMQENFGSLGSFKEQVGDAFRQIGEQEDIVSQRWWMRNGKPQFWHTAEFSQIPEPVVLRFVVEPDGTISGIGFNPRSQNPPVDDPNQHGEGVEP